jgi:tRNA-2-methylthio-N6-dimethylallyladenosine synthase
MAKKLWIKTYGCQMNVYDSQRMADVLAPLGYQATDCPESADMIVLNTCHIREKAAEKVYSELGRIKRLKADREAGGGRMVLAVAGCVAQAEGNEILRRAPQVDLVFGPQTYHRLPELVARVHREGGGVVDTDFPVEPKFDFLPEEQRLNGPSAYLSVQEGCDKFCSFCVVPYTRGAEFSRPVSEVLAEARRLVAAGAIEITVLGQNVNAYHGEGPNGRTWGLGRLIRALSEIDGLRRIRYTTSHPLDMDDDLISAHRDTPALMPYLHLPVQSGSDRILRAMNRRHRAEDFMTIVERLRSAQPGIALSSDFIVGFPGETADDFAATLRLVTDVGFAQAYSFKFSPRPGTPAAGADDQVPDPVKGERLTMLQELLNAQQLSFNQASVGRDVEVLFEGPGRKKGQLIGRSPHMQAVHLEGARRVADRVRGRIALVRIESAHPNSVGATLSPQSDMVPADEAPTWAPPMTAEGRV